MAVICPLYESPIANGLARYDSNHQTSCACLALFLQPDSSPRQLFSSISLALDVIIAPASSGPTKHSIQRMRSACSGGSTQAMPLHSKCHGIQHAAGIGIPDTAKDSRSCNTIEPDRKTWLSSLGCPLLWTEPAKTETSGVRRGR